MSGAFAETISTNTTHSSAKTYSGDVIVNRGVTLTITTTDTVKINGNLINDGGTIVVDAGILIVNGNVTNRTVSTGYTYNTFSTVTTYQRRNGSSYVDSGFPETNPQNNDRKYVIEKSRTINIGNIVVSNGGKININGDFSNNAASIAIETTASEAISSVTVHGNLTNTETTISFTEKTKTTQYTYDSYWRDWNRDYGYPQEQNETKSFVSNITLTNGYLLVDGNLKLEDNSTITFAGSGIGDDVKSTLRVGNINGAEGNVSQSENAVITLASSGAKGVMVVQGVYDDATNVNSATYHPWYMEDDELVVLEDFSFYVNSYNSTFFQTTLTTLNNQYDSFNEGNLWYLTEDKEQWERENRNKGWFYDPWKRNDKWIDYISSTAYRTRMNTFFTEAIAYYGDEEILSTLASLKEDGNLADEIENISSSISSLLPIELTSFTATATDYGFAFNWVTASEVENDYFTLEYSIDGVDFNEIDYVHGAGTTSETSEYEYRWDEAPEFDVVYFRLKQTDYNGEYSYSDVIAASRKKSSGANGTFRYGPLNLQIVDGELRYIQK